MPQLADEVSCRNVRGTYTSRCTKTNFIAMARGEGGLDGDNLISHLTSIVGEDPRSPIPSMAAHALEKWTGRARILVH
jgi:hypothetical protein